MNSAQLGTSQEQKQKQKEVNEALQKEIDFLGKENNALKNRILEMDHNYRAEIEICQIMGRNCGLNSVVLLLVLYRVSRAITLSL